MTKWVIPDTPSPEAIVRAALERAAEACNVRPANGWSEEIKRGYLWAADDFQRYIRALASDPAEVAAIIAKAGEDRG